MVTRTLAARPLGPICPYPMVANVWMLKKNAWLKRPPSMWLPGPASASGPHRTKSTPNSRLMPRYSAVTKPMNDAHDTVSRC